MSARFAVAAKFGASASKLFIVSDGVAEFVVQVVDRHSPILRRLITETNVWAAPQVDRGTGKNPTLARFAKAAVDGAPILRLPVASVDAACEALEARAA